MLEKKKLRDIAESISGIRPENRSLEGIVSFIEEQANIVYEKQPNTFLGRLRELGYALNGVRPSQRSLRGIVNNIYENFNPEPPVPPVSNKIYGVSGLFAQSATLTRTDDAVGMTFTKNADGTITSDFDNVFPYNQMKRVVIKNKTINEDDYFVKIPAMWFRIGLSQYNQITDIAVSQVKGDGDGWYQTKEFYYGAYSGMKRTIDGTAYLTSSNIQVNPFVTTIADFRQCVKNSGEKYQMLDLYHKTIMNFLFLIEFANKNSSSLFPMTYNAKQKMTLTDTITTPSGVLDNGRLRWHYIEDIFGNIKEWLEGVYGNFYATADSSKFGEGGYNELAYFNSSNATNLKNYKWDNDNLFLCMFDSTGGDGYFNEKVVTMKDDQISTYTYVCGKDYTDNTNNYFGMFGIDVLENTSFAGARLLYCPNGV